ncbi:MAG: single-stranded DNA-binding protein [Nitrospirota bacterium]
MPNDTNNCIFTGTLGRDIELKYVSNNMAIASFSIAVNSTKKVGNEWKSETDWIMVKCFGKQAESIAERAQKGTPLMVSGRLKQEKWETKDGEKKERIIVLANSVEVLLRPRKDAQGGTYDNYGGSNTRTAPDEFTDLEPF